MYCNEKDAERMAVRLAVRHCFGVEAMAGSTFRMLDPTKLKRIKFIVISKFGAEKSKEDKDALWRRCKIAINQTCKFLSGARKCLPR